MQSRWDCYLGNRVHGQWLPRFPAGAGRERVPCFSRGTLREVVSGHFQPHLRCQTWRSEFPLPQSCSMVWQDGRPGILILGRVFPELRPPRKSNHPVPISPSGTDALAAHTHAQTAHTDYTQSQAPAYTHPTRAAPRDTHAHPPTYTGHTHIITPTPT